MIRAQAVHPSSQSEPGTPVITGRHVLFAIVGFFVLVTGVNGIMIYKALTTFGGVETQDAYRKGLAYNQRIAAEEAQAALGWHDELGYSAADRALTLALKDRDGRPVTGASVTATVGRSATNSFDQTLTMSESSAGQYRAPVSLAPGTWIVDAAVSHEAAAGKTAEFAIRRRIWLKP
jgi:nitrogen fixation protein FixH